MELVLLAAIIPSMVLDVPKIVVLIVCIVTANIAVTNVYLDSIKVDTLVEEHALFTVSIVLQIPIAMSVNLVFMEFSVVIIVIHNVRPVSHKSLVLPVRTDGLDIYANVAKTAKTEIAMAMESV